MTTNLVSGCLILSCVAILWAPGDAREGGSLDGLLEPYLAKYELPALGAAVVVDGKIVASGAIGTRKVGAKIPVSLDDRFHLGSDTKAMTALIAAMLVEEGKLRWDSTVAEVFPELAKDMDPRLKRVTLLQLLSHSSGIPRDNDAFVKLLEKAMVEDGNLDEIRYWMTTQWCREPLDAEPGTRFAYANMGYILAGAMIERVTGKPWDELITERIFKPLELRTAGLGNQASLGKIDAPLGHVVVDGKVKALLSGPNGDNPPVMGPAGIAHMSVLDFARWAGWNAGQGRRGPQLVKPETLKKLHTPVIRAEVKDPVPGTPPTGKYGLGWGEVAVNWAPHPLVIHTGSNNRSLAHIWLDPGNDFAMVMVTNISGRKADEALYKLAAELYGKFAHRKP